MPLPALAVVSHLDAEERRHVGDARRLLHVVRDDRDRVVALELVDEIFDARRRDRIERRRRLVHEDHVGLDCERARDAESLLLAAGEAERVLLEAVLHLVPERGMSEHALDALVEILLHAEHARPEGDVVVDRLRERIRLLEHHADPTPNLDLVDLGRVQVTAVVEDLPVDLRAGDLVVHPVQAADERALPAARRPDERGDRVLVHVERRLAERQSPAVRHRESVDVEDDVAGPHVGRRRAGQLADATAVESRCGGRLVHDCQEHAFARSSMRPVSRQPREARADAW